MLISSCQKEGPLGFKTGQKYTYSSEYPKTYEVIDVGEDWVEFENESGSRLRVSEAKLEKYLSSWKLQ